MNTKTLINGIASAVGLFLGGFLVYGLIMAGYFMENTPSYPGLMKEPMELWAIGVGDLFWGLLLAWILGMGGVSSVGRGATVGGILFFLYALGSGFVSFAQMNLYSVQMIIVDAICMAVVGAIGGVIAGWMIGRTGKTVNG